MSLPSARRLAGSAAHHPTRGSSSSSARPSHRPFALPHSVNVSALIAKDTIVEHDGFQGKRSSSETAAQDPLREERARLERHFSASWRGRDTSCERLPGSKWNPTVSCKAMHLKPPARVPTTKTFIASSVSGLIRSRASRRCSPRTSSLVSLRKARHRTMMLSGSDSLRKHELLELFLDSLEAEIIRTVHQCVLGCALATWRLPGLMILIH
jgi:hypothetical protein